MYRVLLGIGVLALPALAALLGACDSQGRGTPPDLGIDGPLPDAPPFSFPDAGDLVGPEMDPNRDDRCVAASLLSLSSGKTTVKGSTDGAFNEFGDSIRCGEAEPLAGPQRYYRFTLSKDTIYRMEVKPQFEAYVYIFSECAQTLINVDCASGGGSGDLWGPLQAGAAATLFFAPPASGVYWLAVDSLTADQAGAFVLSVEPVEPLEHGSCDKAKPLTWTGNMIQVNDTTLGAHNEFDETITCGLGFSLDGPQVYYSVQLEEGVWYRFDLSPQFLGSLYVVNSAGDCKPNNIDLDCGGKTGTVLSPVAPGTTAMTAFSPPVSGTYIVVVDSLDPKHLGSFSFKILTMIPPGNMTCSSAVDLSWANQSVIDVFGDTSLYFNDLGAHVDCVDGPPLLAPQAYYQVSMGGDFTYRLVLTPSFSAVLAIGTSCLTLPVDCGSGDLSGGRLAVEAGTTGTMLFTPAATAKHVLTVDGVDNSSKGPFELQIEPYVPPTNGICPQPTSLPLTSSPLVELGDTGTFTNDLTGVDCGDPQGPWSGPQAYYQVSLKAGISYTVSLQPEPVFDPALYAFDATTACETGDINTACTGQSSDQVGAGVEESLTITPAVDTDYVVVVDSWSPSEVGSFTLSISW